LHGNGSLARRRIWFLKVGQRTKMLWLYWMVIKIPHLSSQWPTWTIHKAVHCAWISLNSAMKRLLNPDTYESKHLSVWNKNSLKLEIQVEYYVSKIKIAALYTLILEDLIGRSMDWNEPL
jgi:hypothetical protein